MIIRLVNGQMFSLNCKEHTWEKTNAPILFLLSVMITEK